MPTWRADAATKPYGCHNREPYKGSFVAQDGGIQFGSPQWPRIEPRFVRVQFRMSPNCQYTHTELGKADPRCAGCKHKLEE